MKRIGSHPWLTLTSTTILFNTAAMSWFLYLLECKSGAYYAGISNNVEARFDSHVQGRGARYTKANPPLRIIACKPYPNRSAASIAEAQLKRMPRHLKIGFFAESAVSAESQASETQASSNPS